MVWSDIATAAVKPYAYHRKKLKSSKPEVNYGQLDLAY
jgi:hypothetical protein